MKIQYCSDLHLEFSKNSKWLEINPIKPVGEILIVAGDTYYLGKEFSSHPWFDYASKNWEQVILIPGNHEFYGGFDAKISYQLDYEFNIRDNVTLVNNKSLSIGGTRFIFTTLWSKIEHQIGPILGSLNDFRLIQINNKRLSIESYNSLFDLSWKFLKAEIDREIDKQTVVVTHHMPSDLCNLPMYKGSKLNEAFCTDLTNEIESSNIYAWIFGHSHGNIENFEIGNTMMLTNQLGYIEHGAEQYYKGNMYFEVNS